MKVAVIGAGTMGRGIAQAFAQCDQIEKVYLCDIKQEFADGGKALHVVDVVVRDNDRADAPDVNPGAPAPAGKLPSAYPAVHKKGRAPGLDEIRIATASARKRDDLHTIPDPGDAVKDPLPF